MLGSIPIPPVVDCFPAAVHTHTGRKLGPHKARHRTPKRCLTGKFVFVYASDSIAELALEAIHQFTFCRLLEVKGCILLCRQICLLPSSKNDFLKVLLSILNTNVTDFKIVHILPHSTEVIHLQCDFHLTRNNYEVVANSTTEMS